MLSESMTAEDAQGMAERLQVLLDTVAEAAALRASDGEEVLDAEELLRSDGLVRERFVEFADHVRHAAGIDLALIDFAARAGVPTSLLINSGDKPTGDWPVWRRIV